MAILNEVYIGRLPEIDQMVTDIHNIREEYKAKGNVSILKSTKVFEKHVQDMWGFKAFLFDIYITDVPNAYTYCVGSCIHVDTAEIIECTSKGYRFCKGSNVAATSKIATSLLLDESISDEEVLAIVLHEIGHSFVERAEKVNKLASAYRKGYLTSCIYYIILSILTLNPFALVSNVKQFFNLFNGINTFNAQLAKITKNIPVLRHISMGTKEFTTFVSTTIDNFFTKLSRQNGGDKDYLKRLEKMKDKEQEKFDKNKMSEGLAWSRSNERLSDDFANMYGFGPQLATGLIKMGAPYKYGVLSTLEADDIQKKTDDVIMQIYALIDAHPGHVDRAIAILEALEQDYKSMKKTDPAIKAAMMEDINEMKNLINDLKKTQKLLNEYNNKYMKKTTKEQVKKGNTETKKEKAYNDRDKINKNWEKNKIDI